MPPAHFASQPLSITPSVSESAENTALGFAPVSRREKSRENFRRRLRYHRPPQRLAPFLSHDYQRRSHRFESRSGNSSARASPKDLRWLERSPLDVPESFRPPRLACLRTYAMNVSATTRISPGRLFSQ